VGEVNTVAAVLVEDRKACCQFGDGRRRRFLTDAQVDGARDQLPLKGLDNLMLESARQAHFPKDGLQIEGERVEWLSCLAIRHERPGHDGFRH